MKINLYLAMLSLTVPLAQKAACTYDATSLNDLVQGMNLPVSWPQLTDENGELAIATDNTFLTWLNQGYAPAYCSSTSSFVTLIKLVNAIAMITAVGAQETPLSWFTSTQTTISDAEYQGDSVITDGIASTWGILAAFLDGTFEICKSASECQQSSCALNGSPNSTTFEQINTIAEAYLVYIFNNILLSEETLSADIKGVPLLSITQLPVSFSSSDAIIGSSVSCDQQILPITLNNVNTTSSTAVSVVEFTNVVLAYTSDPTNFMALITELYTYLNGQQNGLDGFWTNSSNMGVVDLITQYANSDAISGVLKNPAAAQEALQALKAKINPNARPPTTSARTQTLYVYSKNSQEYKKLSKGKSVYEIKPGICFDGATYGGTKVRTKNIEKTCTHFATTQNIKNKKGKSLANSSITIGR